MLSPRHNLCSLFLSYNIYCKWSVMPKLLIRTVLLEYPAMQVYFGHVSAHFVIGRHLGFGKFGGLGLGKICQLEEIGRKCPNAPRPNPLPFMHPITVQDGRIKNLVYWSFPYQNVTYTIGWNLTVLCLPQFHIP